MMYIKIKKLYWILILLITGILVACNNNNSNDNGIKVYNEEIKVNSQELFSDSNRIAKIHVKDNTSEYITVDCSDSQEYTMQYQLWKDGQLFLVEDKILNLNLVDYEGFSFELYESAGNLEVLSGLYTESGENGVRYPIEDIENYNLNRIIETKVIENYTVENGEEIFLWAIHEIKEGSDINEMNENEYDVASKSNWSIIFSLVPSEK